MKKRFLAMLLALVMVVSMLPLAAFAATEKDPCVGNYTTHDWDESTGKCKRYTGSSYYNRVYCNAECTHAAGFELTSGFMWWDQSNTCKTCGFECDHQSYGQSQFSSTGLCSGCGYQCPHDDVNQTTHKCELCDATIQPPHEHRYDPEKGTGVCEEDGCDELCQHPAKDGSAWSDGRCKTCGKPCDHDWENGECETCGQACDHEWAGGECETCGLTCQHAAYGEDYKCTTCGAECDDHEYNKQNPTGNCTTCGKPCTHAAGYDNNNKCNTCGMTQHTHTYSPDTGKCTYVGCNAECPHAKYDSATGKCENCQMPHNHETWEYVRPQQTNPPTCETGGVDVYRCKGCGYESGREADPLGHDEYVIVPVFNATCTVGGISVFGCKRCNDIWMDIVAAKGHTEEIVPAVDATCTSTGLTEGKKCTVCGETVVAQVVVDKLPHEFTVDVSGEDATCTADGFTDHKKCANCDATEGKEEIDTDGHNFEHYICTKCGVRDGSCVHPKDKVEITVKKATCSETGYEKFACKECGYTYHEILEKVAHKEVDKSYESTCTEPGLTLKVCKKCGEEIVREEIPQLKPHTNVGGTCSVCGTVLCSNHTWKTTSETESTCSVQGVVTKTCSNCGKVERTYLDKKAHNYLNGVCTVCSHHNSGKSTVDYNNIFIVG